MPEKTSVSRRQFLKTTGYALLGLTVTCSGLTYAAARAPKIEMIEKSYGGKEKMENKILIAYASKTGSTAGVADRLGQTLSQSGLTVDVRPVNEVSDLAPYGAVVLGSAIRAGSLLPEMTGFMEANQAALQALPTAVFICCMTLAEDTPENRKTVDAYLDPVRGLIQPAATATFAGAMDYNKLSFAFRMIVKALKTPEGDYRNWPEITAWADNLPEVLIPAA